MIRLVLALSVAILAGACAVVSPEAAIDGWVDDETPVRLVPIEGVP